MQDKKTLLIMLALLIIFSVSLFADPVFYEGFETAWTGSPIAPTGWVSNASWVRSTTFSYTGLASARVGYSAGNYWLVTPQITIPAGNYRLKFAARDHSSATNYDYPDEYLKVYSSNTFTGDFSVFTNQLASFGYLDTNTSWAYYYIDLSSFSGQTLYLGLNRTSTGGNYVYIDEFTVEPILSLPPNPATYVFPMNNAPSMNNPLLKWTFSPTGEQVNGYKLYLSTSQTFGEPIYNGPLTSFQTTDLLPSTQYFWKVIPYNQNGEATGITTSSFTTASPEQLVESFEGVTYPPAGWDRDGTTWSSSTSNYYEGIKAVSVSTSSATTPATAKKLITPKLTIDASSYIRLLCYTTATPVQSIQLKTSPDKVTWTNFGEPYALTAGSWNVINANLGTLTPGNYYIAMGAFGAGTGTIYLDYVIGPNITPEIPGITSNPTPIDLSTGVYSLPTLTWTAPSTGGVPSGYKIYLDTVNPPLTMVGTVNTNAYTATAHLSYSTQYYWSVVPTNSAGDATGCPVWSFTVMEDPTVAVPYVQNFASFPPTNWERKSGLLTTNSILTNVTTGWIASTNFGNVADNPNGPATRLNIFGANTKNWLITPPINLGTGATPLQLDFDLALTKWNNANEPDTNGVDDRFAVLISTDNGITWSSANTLKLWDNDPTTISSVYQGISLTGEHVVIPLTGRTGIVRFAFYGESTVSNADNDMHIDNVKVREVPTDPIFAVDPTEKNYGNVIINTTSSQIFTVTNIGESTLNVSSITLTGANANQFALVLGTPVPWNLTNLQSHTFTVNFTPTTIGNKIAQVNITDNLTRTVHTVSLTGTGFDPTISVLPYTQNFDAQTTIDLPTNWTSYASHTGADDRAWVTQVQTADNPGAVSQPNFIGSFFHSTYPKNEWAVTPPIHLIGGTPYQVRFMVRAPGWQGTPEKMKLAVSQTNTLAALVAGTVIWDDPNMLIADYTEKTAPFTPTTTGNYYFGWNSYSAADVNYIAMDDITIELAPVFNAPTALNAIAGDAQVELNWTAPVAGSTGTLSGYNVYRNDILLNTTPITAITYTDNTVENNTLYSYYVKAVYTNPAGLSNPSNTVQAYPMALYPPENLTANVNDNDVTLNWIAGGFDFNRVYQKSNPANTTIIDNAKHKQVMSLDMTPCFTENIKRVETSNLRNVDRILTGFKVYRGTTLLTTTPLPSTTLTYTDIDVAYGQYTYKVTAVYTEGESDPTEIVVNVVNEGNVIMNETFDTYDNFALEFGQWILRDLDQSATSGIEDITFPGSDEPMAFMIFNPSATTPAATDISTHSGAKMAASFVATTPPNNDWMITPSIQLTAGGTPKIKFWAKSLTAQYGLERFVVCVGTSSDPAQMTPISTGDYVEAPVEWTEFEYPLTSYIGQTIRVGLHCVSNDAFAFFVDDFRVYGNGQIVSNHDIPLIPSTTVLLGNYPNPFNPVTTIKYALKEKAHVSIEIFNVKGQKVRTLVNGIIEAGTKTAVWNGKDDNNRSIGSGVYFYKMKSGSYVSNGKMILMK